jgi:PAS domain S-box-containing protein
LKNKLHILVVDDDQDILFAIQRTLEAEDYNVSIASDAKKCLEILNQNIPDLLLLDVVLPDSNGMDLAKEILSKEEYNTIPILIMSGLKRNLENSFQSGAVDFISKPLSMKDLKNKIYTIFRIKDLEQQKLKQEAKYDELINNVSDLIFALDLQGNIIYLNAAFKKITGFNKLDWQNKPFASLVTKNDQKLWDKTFTSIQKGSKQPKFEIHINIKDNHITAVDILLSNLYDEEVRTGYLGIAVDLSSEKLQKYTESQEEKILSHEREQNIWENLSQGNTSITSQTFETTVLNNTESEIYKELLNTYKNIIEKNIESRIYKTENDTSKQIKELAHEMGFLNANPKDVIRIHKEFFKKINHTIHPKKLIVYLEESRIILLEIMGYLVNYYRTHM